MLSVIPTSEFEGEEQPQLGGRGLLQPAPLGKLQLSVVKEGRVAMGPGSSMARTRHSPLGTPTTQAVGQQPAG